MGALIRFFTKILDICKLVPMLPVVVIAAIPLALLGDWRPWGNAMAIPVLGNPGFGQWLVIALVLIIVIDTVRGMIDDLRHGQVGVDVLAVVAILSTVAVAEYWASWAVTLMITSGEAIEEYAQAKAERSLTALMEAAPQTAHVVNLPGVGRGFAAGKGDSSDGFRRVGLASAAAAAHRFDTVPVEQVQLGDVLMVLPGETVPVDGELLSGTATLDLSNINGEPVPREVFAGARVMSGAVNGSTALTMRATQVAADSQYQRILELVASAQESRPAVVKTADRLAVPFTVLSLMIAGIAWAMSGVPTRFAQVLVLATPCPLLIAAPVAYIAGTGRLAAAGVLIKAQDVLENLGRVTQVFFDKTGTLTNAEPVLERVISFSHYSEDEILKIAACIEEHFPHSVARAIVKGAADRNLNHQEEHAEVQYIVAHGIATTLHGKRAVIGSHHFVSEDEHVAITPEQQAEIEEKSGGCSVVYLAIGGELSGVLCISDPPRKEAKQAIQLLKRAGISNIVMLTGDSQKAAEVTAEKLGITQCFAQVLPEDKHRYVEQLKADGHRVIMVGDGINDAPALAAANVSVAMSDASDIAREAADITLRGTDLTELATLRTLSEKLMARIHRNYRFIIAFNSSLLLLGLFGVIAPTTSAFLHNASTMAICAKSMTPVLKKPSDNKENETEEETA